MAVNFYNTPSRNRFVDTYDPIPFDSLNQLAQVSRQERLMNEQKLEDYRVKYGDFNSRSQRDIDTWNKEVTSKVKDVANRVASNPDSIKGEEGRMLISGLINNTNYGLLNTLKQNATNLEEAYKTYDRRWQDDTLNQISNWDTSTQGLYDNQNIEYKSINEIVNPYFDKIEPTLDLKMSNGQYDYYTITNDDLSKVASTSLNEMYSDPAMRKHLTRMGIDKLPVEQQQAAARQIVMQTQQDRVGIKKRVERKDYIANLNNAAKIRIQQLNNAAKASGSGSGTSGAGIVPTRTDYALSKIVSTLSKNSSAKSTTANGKNFIANGVIDTGDAVMSTQLKAYNNIYVDLYNKYEASKSGGPKLSSDEMDKLSKIQTLRDDVLQLAPEKDAMDYKIETLEKSIGGLSFTIPMKQKFVNDLRSINNEMFRIKLMVNNDLLGVDEKNKSALVERYNQLNNQLNQKTSQLGQYVSNMDSPNKKDLVNRLDERNNASLGKSEVDDYMTISMGTRPVLQKVGDVTKIMEVDGRERLVKVKGVNSKVPVGIEATTANKLFLRNYNLNNSLTSGYVNSTENNTSGNFANKIFTDPSYFNLGLSPEQSAKFGNNTAPIIIESNQGKVNIQMNDVVKDGKFTTQPEFAASQIIKIPRASLDRYIKENNTLNSNGKQSSPEALIKHVTGVNPDKEVINGVEYLTLEGASRIFDDDADVNVFNHNYKTKGVKYGAKFQESYMSPEPFEYGDEDDSYFEEEE